MSWWLLLVIVGFAVVLVWLALTVVLLVAGRREEAWAFAGFIPDCPVLTGRLMSDPRVPRRRKLLLAGLVGYLTLPFDLVPDFIPVAGQLDDVLVVGLVLRRFLRSGGEELVRQLPCGYPRRMIRVSARPVRKIAPREMPFWSIEITETSVPSGERLVAVPGPTDFGPCPLEPIERTWLSTPCERVKKIVCPSGRHSGPPSTANWPG
jgi:uncharacterized membrane protein YkvA (DUF1232 family)